MSLTRTPFRRWRDLGRRQHFPDPALRAKLKRLPPEPVRDELLASYEAHDGWTEAQKQRAHMLIITARHTSRSSQLIPHISCDGMIGLKRLFSAAEAAGVKRPTLRLSFANLVGFKLFDPLDRSYLGKVSEAGGVYVKTGARMIADEASRIGEDPWRMAKLYAVGGACLFCCERLPNGFSVHTLCSANWNLKETS